MLKTILICDKCGEEIPTYEKEVLKGVKRRFYKTGKSKYLPHMEDTLHIDLCERCAVLVDVEILEWKICVLGGK